MASRRHLTTVTEAAAEALTLSEVKMYAKVDGNVEDSLLEAYITSARIAMQEHLRRSIINQSLMLTLDQDYSCAQDQLGEGVYQLPPSVLGGGLASVIELPKPPLVSVTSVKTYDLDNTETTVSSTYYTVDTAGGRVFLNSGYIWPSSLRQLAAMKITYVAGYGTANTSVPRPIRQGMLMHIKLMYDSRLECDMPAECKSLVSSFRIMDRLALNG